MMKNVVKVHMSKNLVNVLDFKKCSECVLDFIEKCGGRAGFMSKNAVKVPRKMWLNLLDSSC